MKLKVTVWAINYAPEVAGIGPYNAALCEFLRTQGHSVRMVTSFPYYPAWAKDPADRRRVFRTDDLNGLNVHRCWHFVPRRPSPLKRILHEGSFVLFSFIRLLFLPRPDVFVVVSPPLLLGAAAWLLSWLQATPYVFHVQDLQPDAAVGMAMLKPGRLIQVLYGLEAFAYRKAARVSGICRGMLAAFKHKGVPDQKILYFPNGVRLHGARPPAGVFRKRLGMAPDDFLAVYSGNLGVKQGLDILIETARLLRNSRIRLIICGDGARRDFLGKQIAFHRLSNVTMLPLQPQAQYEEMLVDADLTLITQQPGSGACFFPGKLLSLLAFSKPILTVADESSELALAVKDGGFGLNVKPGDAQAVAVAIESLALDPGRLRTCSTAGARFVLQYEFRTVLARLEQDLLSLAGSPAAEKSLLAEKPVGTEPVGA